MSYLKPANHSILDFIHKHGIAADLKVMAGNQTYWFHKMLVAGHSGKLALAFGCEHKHSASNIAQAHVTMYGGTPLAATPEQTIDAYKFGIEYQYHAMALRFCKIMYKTPSTYICMLSSDDLIMKELIVLQESMSCKSESCCKHPPVCRPRRPPGVPLTHIGYVTCDLCCEHALPRGHALRTKISFADF